MEAVRSSVMLVTVLHLSFTLCHKLNLITLRVTKLFQPIYKTVTATTQEHEHLKIQNR
jgi:hypothetical protein